MKTLQKAREDKGLSQSSFLQLAGIHQINLSSVEKGEAIPHPRTRKRIEAVLGPIDWINTARYPKMRSKRKKVSRDEVQVKFVHLMEDILLLDSADKYWVLAQINNCILNYFKTDSDKREMSKTQIKLLQERLVFSDHKN